MTPKIISTGKFLHMFTSQLFKESAIFLSKTGIHTGLDSKKVLIFRQEFQMFSFPEQYGGKHMGIGLSMDQLKDVAGVSGVMGVGLYDFMCDNVKQECMHYLPDPSTIESKNAIVAFRFLKANVNTSRYYSNTLCSFL